MITIHWNPTPHLGPIPINWYGLTWVAGFLVSGALVRRWAITRGVSTKHVENLVLWILLGAMVGARLYFIVQNEPGSYLREPWRIIAIWEGGLAFFGGLFGGIGAAWLYARRTNVSFPAMADLFAPAIPIGSAIGRISCFLDGMDYGTPTALPWGVVYTHPNSYAPSDGLARHPDQVYELVGDIVIATILLKLRRRLSEGGLFMLYLVLFSALRFVVFFVRGNVPVVALGLKNGQWTAIAILVVALSAFLVRWQRRRRT